MQHYIYHLNFFAETIMEMFVEQTELEQQGILLPYNGDLMAYILDEAKKNLLQKQILTQRNLTRLNVGRLNV